MPLVCLAVGKKHEDWVQGGIERYQKRLRAPFVCEWVLLPHSAREGAMARQEESERLLKMLRPDDVVILLDERGVNYSSPDMASYLTEQFNQSRRVVLIIGGAYGVSDELRHRAHRVWSLSKLVFPHQLVRLILVEQLYRTQEITRQTGYHHD